MRLARPVELARVDLPAEGARAPRRERRSPVCLRDPCRCADDGHGPEHAPQVEGLWQAFLDSGGFEAPFSLRGADGARIDVFSSARARMPWPGCHTSLLTPHGAEPELDVDEALLEAGFVSRQRTSGDLAAAAAS